MEEVDVQPPVVVEVEQGGARADDLRHEIAPGGTGVVNEVQADLLGDVFKPAGRGRFLDNVCRRSTAACEPAGDNQDNTKTGTDRENARKHELPGGPKTNAPFGG